MPNPKTLLVIEPHENLRDAYASVLRYAGYRVQEAECAVTAGERLEAATPRLALMNVHLPTVADGLWFLRRHRRDPLLRSTVWVALCDSRAALNPSEQREFDAVLCQPLSYTDLIGAAAVYAGSADGHGVGERMWEACFS
jgi:CheY-like chemotaxis protein